MTNTQINIKLNAIFRAFDKQWRNIPAQSWQKQRIFLTKQLNDSGLLGRFDNASFWRAFSSMLDMKYLEWEDQKKLIRYIVKWANQ